MRTSRVVLAAVACLSIPLQVAGAGGASSLLYKPEGPGKGRVVLDGRPLLDVSAIPGSFTVAFEDGALVLKGRFARKGTTEGARIDCVHHVNGPRRVWVPHAAPASGNVMGDHSFRSPAVVLANESLALVLIPDLDDVRKGYESGWRTWLDYDHPARTVSIAAGSYRVAGAHVLYRKEPLACSGQPVRLRLHVVASRRGEDTRNPYGLAARWIWKRWGHPRHLEGGSQKAPLGKYCEYTRRWAFDKEGWGETVWQEFEIDGRRCGAPAFIVDVVQHPSVPLEKRRWREQRSIWNQAWFSTQRCANGLLRLGRLTGSKDLQRRARLSTEIALAAPQTDGLFPAVYTTAPPGARKSYQLYKDTPGWDRGRWTNSDRRPPGVSEAACHVLDAAFTARLLLEWLDLTGDERVSGYVKKFADRLCRLQRPSGAFPGWVEPDGTAGAILAEGPESAMGATFLLELAAAAESPRSQDAARWRETAFRALDYLARGPVAEGRWEDFETYFSCSRWGGDRIGKKIARNGVFKQNTFSPFWCAEAFLAGYRASGRKTFLALGRRCLDELSLFQQAWDPPYIPAPCHGGFGVMNADGEWNDARQSLFAPLYLEYYKETGLAEYFERGVAALRASFAMMYCPENKQVKRQYELRHPFFGPESYGFMMENIAHGGPAPADGSAIGVFTIYTWGNGAALASAAKIRDLFGDIYVDLERKEAFGIDGCVASVKDGAVRVADRFGRSSLLAVFSDGTRKTVNIEGGKGNLPLAGKAASGIWKDAWKRRGIHRFSTLFTAHDVRERLASVEGIREAIGWCKETGITRVFIETFRNGYQARRETLIRARDLFRKAGIEVSGCVTTTLVGKRSTGWSIIACYTDKPTQEHLRRIFEYTASLFDEIMIDDFWFTDCTCPACDAARKARTVSIGDATYAVRGDTWEDYRSELMVQLSRNYILAAAKRVNPRVKVIVKYPQWYDRFHERGYDVARETRDFDRIWVGTETRDYTDKRWGGTVQYEAYFIMRWLGGIGGEKCGGGWFDPLGTTEKTYVEQARQTVLAGARESLLFCYGALHRDSGPQDVAELRRHIPELLDVAAEVRRRKVVGVAAYKPPSSHAGKEPRIFDFAGMMGLPLVPCHELEVSPAGTLPRSTPAAFFSVHALKDPRLAQKLQTLVKAGTPILVTDGLARRLEGAVKLDAPSVRILKVGGKPKSLLEMGQADLDRLRAPLLEPLGVSFKAPNRVGLYLFEDGSRVVENFNDEAVTVELNGRVRRVPARGWACEWNDRPRIRKLGTVRCDVVESTPVVFKDRLYRFEWMRSGNPENKLKKNYFHFIDLETGKATRPFAMDHAFGSAFVENDIVYVTGTSTEAGWTGQRVDMFVSRDMESWKERNALDLKGWGICNTSICKAGTEYVLMFEIHKPPGEAGHAFTPRFARSTDLEHWQLTPSQCVYGKDRYAAPHCLRYDDGWYYLFYLEAGKPAGYETYVVRSRDLVHWASSPLNPVLKASAGDKKIACEALSAAQRARIEKARDINNSDIDFCEHEGRLIIYYSWGNQQGEEFLAQAVHDGTLEEFLRGWFPR